MVFDVLVSPGSLALIRGRSFAICVITARRWGRWDSALSPSQKS